MVTAAADTLAFTEGMAEDDFLTDLRTQRAVVMSLMIVGEAASRILSDHPDFANAKTAIPWRGIRGMRNRIAHGYFDIGEYPKLCVSDRAHAVFRYGQASKRPANIMAS